VNVILPLQININFYDNQYLVEAIIYFDGPSNDLHLGSHIYFLLGKDNFTCDPLYYILLNMIDYFDFSLNSHSALDEVISSQFIIIEAINFSLEWDVVK